MPDNEKLVVCPADTETTPVARYCNMLDGYSLQGMVSPGGWVYANNDVNFVDGGYETGIRFTDDFDMQLDLCDTIMFCDSYNSCSFEKYLLPKILKAKESKKKILLSFREKKEYGNGIHSALKGYTGATFLNWNGKYDMPRKDIRHQLYSINTPVIFIMGLGDRCNKFETQLELRRYFMDMGYKVCQVGSKGYSSIFGFDAVPNFLYSDSYNIEEKIYLFNYYIKMQEKEKKPDVFIIGIPGGIMPFNGRETNHFGIIPYIVSNAVKPDCVVLNIYYNFFMDEYFAELNNYCKYKFGFEITGFNIANTRYSVNLEDKAHYLNFLSLDSNYVMSNIPKTIFDKWKLFNPLQKQNDNSMAEYIYDVLAGNISVLKSS